MSLTSTWSALCYLHAPLSYPTPPFRCASSAMRSPELIRFRVQDHSGRPLLGLAHASEHFLRYEASNPCTGPACRVSIYRGTSAEVSKSKFEFECFSLARLGACRRKSREFVSSFAGSRPLLACEHRLCPGLPWVHYNVVEKNTKDCRYAQVVGCNTSYRISRTQKACVCVCKRRDGTPSPKESRLFSGWWHPEEQRMSTSWLVVGCDCS